MKATTYLRLIATWSILAVWSLYWPDSLWLIAAQKKGEQGGLIIIPEKKKTSKSKLKKNSETSTTTPIVLPEVDADSNLMLAPSPILKFIEPPALKLEADLASVTPPSAFEDFSFETLTYEIKGRFKQSVEKSVGKKLARAYRESLGNGVWLELVEVPGGVFRMGSSEGGDSEQPQHNVTLPKFWIGKYEVTQAQWHVVSGLPKVERDLVPDPSHFKGDNLPVEKVSWDEAVEFCNRLAKKTGKPYRLPTEAEWEYAARGGTTTPFAFGKILTPEIVNYNGNYTWDLSPKGEYRGKTTPVGSLKQANGFGLFDMHGNVWEWCQDKWHPNYKSATTDGSARESGEEWRAIRGGSWYDSPDNCRSASRTTYTYALVRNNQQGLRVVVSKVF